LRFNVTHEFENFTLSDWLDNKKWFDVKLLVDPSGGRFEKAMTNDSYAKAIKAVLLGLGIAAVHLVHLGRNLGPKLLEMLEEESDAIRQLGNWNPSMQDSCYSTKLPMRPIRKLAGFVNANGMHYNPRTMVEVPEELARLTPIGGWAIDAFRNIGAAVSEQGLPKFTAYNVLKFLVELNWVFLQDAAAMMINHPERVCNPLFRLEVFQLDQFLVSRDDSTVFLFHLLSCLLTYLVKTFRNCISLAIADTGESPLDAKLEAVLPGVHHRLVANQREVVSLRNLVEVERRLQKHSSVRKRQRRKEIERPARRTCPSHRGSWERGTALLRGLLGGGIVMSVMRRQLSMEESTQQPTVSSQQGLIALS
jgi:hypothetical protein